MSNLTTDDAPNDNVDSHDIQVIYDDLCEMFIQAATECDMKKVFRNNTRGKPKVTNVPKNQKWFNQECKN